MKNKILLLLVILLSAVQVIAQDRIVKISGEEIEAVVKEISDTEIKYKKFSNPDGPTYVVKTRDVAYIQYKNGEKEVYNETPVVNGHRIFGVQFDEEKFKKLAAKGNKVYYESNNKNAIAHARSKLMGYGFWEETRNKKDADFVLYF